MLNDDLTDELCLITGASGGIGRATALTLASHGCNIAVHYHQSKEAADQLVTELVQRHVNAMAFQADMGNYDEVRNLHAQVRRRMGDPTILFANAGSNGGKSNVEAVEDVSMEVFETTWRVNCGAPYLLTQLCLPAMLARQRGRIIFCSSVAAFTGGVVGPHYASSKSALHGLIHWLSQKYCAQGVTVNGVAPALIGGTGILPGDNTAELAKKIPLGRLGEPAEVAETVAWMVRTGYVTNKVVGVDGGWFPQ